MSLDAIVSVSLWMILPLGFVGSLLHFAFDWSKHNRIVALFSAVNESSWEHIKIAVWPVALLQLILFAGGGYERAAFIPAATIALYSVPISMLGIVAMYKSVTKRNVLWIDITVFFVVIAIAQLLFVVVLTELAASWLSVALASVFLVGLLVAFLRFTLNPPREPDAFIDPLNHSYGLDAHPDYEAT